EAGLDRVARQRGPDLAHRPPQVDLYHVAAQLLHVDVGEVLRRVGLELLQEHAVARDLGLGLAIGRARHPDADRAARAVTRKSDHAYVVAEVLAAELCADAGALGEPQDLL